MEAYTFQYSTHRPLPYRSIGRQEKPLNTATLPATVKLALYEGLAHTLVKNRSEKQKKIAKLI